MLEKDAIEYLINEGEMKDPIVNLSQGTFSKESLKRITFPTADTLKVSTLTAIVDYIKKNVDKLDDNLIIHIKSEKEVNLYGPLTVDSERNCYLQALAILPSNIYYREYMDTETFNIMLQSSFSDKGDKETLLKYTGLIRDEAVKTTGDDGISQQVTIKTGVASVAQAVVPNPATLAPYRTFQEIEQVESKFIFRMKDGPRAAIFEADGGQWRNETIIRIKTYLNEQLNGIDNIEILA